MCMKLWLAFFAIFANHANSLALIDLEEIPRQGTFIACFSYPFPITWVGGGGGGYGYTSSSLKIYLGYM